MAKLAPLSDVLRAQADLASECDEDVLNVVTFYQLKNGKVRGLYRMTGEQRIFAEAISLAALNMAHEAPESDQ